MTVALQARRARLEYIDQELAKMAARSTAERALIAHGIELPDRFRGGQDAYRSALLEADELRTAIDHEETDAKFVAAYARYVELKTRLDELSAPITASTLALGLQEPERNRRIRELRNSSSINLVGENRELVDAAVAHDALDAQSAPERDMIAQTMRTLATEFPVLAEL